MADSLLRPAAVLQMKVIELPCRENVCVDCFCLSLLSNSPPSRSARGSLYKAPLQYGNLKSPGKRECNGATINKTNRPGSIKGASAAGAKSYAPGAIAKRKVYEESLRVRVLESLRKNFKSPASAARDREGRINKLRIVSSDIGSRFLCHPVSRESFYPFSYRRRCCFLNRILCVALPTSSTK